MAQLIKLQDYISRYEKDTFHYPGQFTRLKGQNWKKLVQTWEEQMEESAQFDQKPEEEVNHFKGWSKFFKRKDEMDREETDQDEQNMEFLPESKDDLKQYFLDTLLPFQLKWASTTISEMSFIDQYYHQDFSLKYFLQRFPDTYLLMYYPILKLKNGPLEGDIILISPVGIEIIKFVEMDSRKTIIAGDDRTWYSEENQVQTRLLSPLLSLKRTEKVIKSILSKYDIEFPIEKVVLSRTNTIEYNLVPYRTNYVGKEQHEQWLTQKRNLVSPLKHRQLKVAELLLNHCYTNAYKRPEWEEETDAEDEDMLE
ncbi:nuclease-related domain-containing protein [Aquibacillus kalidii]|uniref:nuclease-related domain-containing protein n=1 Tax=Aquibacillus kalidii TaxID=2762597 RepID=UPI001647EF1B|nr:nuclease-related domain-containing protein [Aquibacillus kalidii]